MKILQINTTVNSGSTGRITEDIGRVLLEHGHQSHIAYGRGNRPSQSHLIKIGNQWDIYSHRIITAISDRHGFGSKKATQKLIQEIENIKPDAIGLHNAHGYYLNIKELFEYIFIKNIPVIWTLFDCWAFTGHCTYFDDIACEKWVAGCFECPKTRRYPASYGLDRSKQNYVDKRYLFTSLDKLELVVHSTWLKGLVKQSFLKHLPVHCLPSGIDIQQFSPVADAAVVLDKYNIAGRSVILGVASIWDPRKGLADFVRLSKLISQEYMIVLIGLSAKQLNNLMPNTLGIPRTESIQELAAWYTVATAFVNPTYLDNFPTTNIEALACGTPVVTYNTGGSPEAIDEETGLVVEKGDILGLKAAIEKIALKGKNHYQGLCRTRAERYFDKNDRYRDYLNLYQQLIHK